MRSFVFLCLVLAGALTAVAANDGFIIKQIYYTGSRTPSGGTYFSDQFVEIFNNTPDTLYADSLWIGDVYGVSGQINPSDVPTPFNRTQDSVFLNSVWMIPGSGRSHPVAPGKSIIIAQDGVNHQDSTLNPASPVNLAHADWEAYNERPDNRDADAPAVPNLVRFYFTGGFDWLWTVFGPGLVVFHVPDSTYLPLVPIPGSSAAARRGLARGFIIDAFEGLKDNASGAFKRIPTAVFDGYLAASGTYTSEAFRRKSSTSTVILGRVEYTNTASKDDWELVTPLTPTAVALDAGDPPHTFTLFQNYPNPFNPSTTIAYSLTVGGAVRLELWNVLGEKVATLVDEHHNPGSYRVTVDGRGLSSGVYFYRLQAGAAAAMRTMILLR